MCAIDKSRNCRISIVFSDVEVTTKKEGAKSFKSRCNWEGVISVMIAFYDTHFSVQIEFFNYFHKLL